MIQVLLRSASKDIISSVTGKEIEAKKSIRVDIGDEIPEDPTALFDMKSVDLSVKEASSLAILLVEAIKESKKSTMGYRFAISQATGAISKIGGSTFNNYRSVLEDDLEKLDFLDKHIEGKIDLELERLGIEPTEKELDEEVDVTTENA